MARDQLVKDWASYPALAKSRCAKPQEYLPGYVEWLTCIEMTRDSLQILKETRAPAPPIPRLVNHPNDAAVVRPVIAQS